MVIITNMHADLLASVTMFMPQRMLHTQPTMTIKVIIWRNAERRLRKKALQRVLMTVGQPHSTVNAEINVPEIEQISVEVIRNINTAASVNDGGIATQHRECQN